MERGAAGFHVDHLSTQSSSGRGDEDISSTRRTDFCGMLLVEQGHPMAARSTAHRSDTHTLLTLPSMLSGLNPRRLRLIKCNSRPNAA